MKIYYSPRIQVPLKPLGFYGIFFSFFFQTLNKQAAVHIVSIT